MKVAVLLSGGVDSSVALKLLLDQGHEVHAFYLKIWLEDELSFLGSCPWEEDLMYVQKICTTLGVPLQVINLQKEYHEEVVSYALKEIKAGRTPNSDLLCNSKVKFGKFYDIIKDDFAYIASGHYADKIEKNGIHYLRKAKDSFKDQTYFLAHLNQTQLSRAIFPLGPYLKNEVRAMARDFGLPNAQRKDSQGICFLGQIKYNEFVKHHLGVLKGDLIDFETQEKLGDHEGYWFYTIGQRKGIKLSGGPWYVVKKDTKKNTVYVSNKYLSNEKVRDNFLIEDLHWLSGAPNNEVLKNLQVKVRHGEQFYEAKLLYSEEGNKVIIQGSDQGFAAGQFAVFYDQDICLGCATII